MRSQIATCRLHQRCFFMAIRLVAVPVSVALLALPVDARAQATPVPPFTTQIVARLDRLAADSAVHARTGAANGMALFAAMPPDAIGRVSDADLVRLLRLVEQGLGSVDAATCALAYGQRGTDGLPQAFVAIASQLDSSRAVPWVDAFMPVFEAGLAKRPLGARVSDADALQAVAQAFGSLSAEDRARMQRGATRTGTPQDVCFFIRTTFSSLLALPVGRSASVLRTLMFGPGS